MGYTLYPQGGISTLNLPGCMSTKVMGIGQFWLKVCVVIVSGYMNMSPLKMDIKSVLLYIWRFCGTLFT